MTWSICGLCQALAGSPNPPSPISDLWAWVGWGRGWGGSLAWGPLGPHWVPSPPKFSYGVHCEGRSLDPSGLWTLIWRSIVQPKTKWYLFWDPISKFEKVDFVIQESISKTPIQKMGNPFILSKIHLFYRNSIYFMENPFLKSIVVDDVRWTIPFILWKFHLFYG